MDAADLVRAVLPAFEPPPELTGSQWAELHRRAPLSSPSGGAAWSNLPPMVEVQDSFADPAVGKLVIVGAHQTGKSEAAHNAVGYVIQHDPSIVLWVMPSAPWCAGAARRVVRTRRQSATQGMSRL